MRCRTVSLPEFCLKRASRMALPLAPAFDRFGTRLAFALEEVASSHVGPAPAVAVSYGGPRFVTVTAGTNNFEHDTLDDAVEFNRHMALGLIPVWVERGLYGTPLVKDDPRVLAVEEKRAAEEKMMQLEQIRKAWN